MSAKLAHDRRVLHVIHGLTVGGAEVDLIDKSVELIRRYGYDITICCLMRRGELASRAEAAGIRVVGPLMRHRYDLFAAGPLRRILLAESWSLVHAHLFAANLVVGATLMTIPFFRRPPFIVAEHAMAERWGRWTFFMYRWLQRQAGLILVPSQASAASYLARGVGEDRLEVVSNAIDVHRFEPVDRVHTRIRIRQQLDIPGESYLVGTICRLEKVKDLSSLIDAVGELPAHLVIAGDGPERARLNSIVQAKQIEGRVQLLGSRHDVPDLLAALDVFVLPSSSESFGIAVAESLLMETPVVATDVGGISEVTDGGRCARLVPPGDPRVLAEAIQWVMDHPEGAQAQAREGRAFVCRTFSLEVVADRQHAIYEQLGSRGEPGAERSRR
jgi:glycosyltransferase involved in cell wall biosynthesis